MRRSRILAPAMILFLPIGFLLLLLGLWYYRRGSSLTRDCRWRRIGQGQGEGQGEGPQWRCAACGASCTVPSGQEPRECLRQLPPQQ